MAYVMGFEQIDRTAIVDVGGKGAQLGELSRIEGIHVPPGFCVTVDAFRQVLAGLPSIDDQLDRLARVQAADRAAIGELSAQIRALVEGVVMPEDVVSAISASLVRLGEQRAYAVRSSATAEDLPRASFAGQHDSYLNVVGLESAVQHVLKCWASLFTERAVTYRRRNGFDDRNVLMAVVVQQMVSPTAAGVMFTADPVTSNRKVATVEAVRGLGEALVSGLVNADVYAVRDDVLVTAADVPKRPTQPVLTDAQVVRLVQLGRRIEAHFGCPQDIEWCLAGDDFHIVQSRPITTLFPIPTTDDHDKHVYISVGHQQMMTDAMKPLGLSLWQLTTPRPMHEAGGRLFVDIAPALATPAGRASLLALAKSDPLTRDALQTVVDRDDLVRLRPDEPVPPAPVPVAIEADPAIVTELIEHSRASVAALRREVESVTGPALIDFIVADIAELKRILFDPRSHQVIMAGIEGTWWLNDQIEAWLGETNAAGALLQSVPDNVTSQMGLALLDVADTIRPHPDVVAFIQRAVDEGRADDGLLDEMAALPGGQVAVRSIRRYLDEYGMRCAGEIDITRTRWSERPATLLPTLLGNINTFEAGAGERRFAQGLVQSQREADELLERLRALPDGQAKAELVEAMIARVRTFAGYREYPKYGMVSRYFVYKQALLREADRLVRAGVLSDREDIYYLRLDELGDVVRTNEADHGLISDRREAFCHYETLVAPRLLTSDGEVITGRYRHEDLPPGALPGLPVSAGIVQGRARVVTDMAQASLEPGDILVTAYTDPSWTPLFLTAAGIVTEVGGLMTHGAVIAREYGLPGVVGVERATRLIRDGQRIRVNAIAGYVEPLD